MRALNKSNFLVILFVRKCEEIRGASSADVYTRTQTLLHGCKLSIQTHTHAHTTTWVQAQHTNTYTSTHTHYYMGASSAYKHIHTHTLLHGCELSIQTHTHAHTATSGTLVLPWLGMVDLWECLRPISGSPSKHFGQAAPDGLYTSVRL